MVSTAVQPSPATPVSIQGRWVVLRPLTEPDYPILYSWRVDASFVALWQTAGRWIPTFKEYVPELERFLADGVTFLVADRASGQVGGFARAYNLNPVDGWAWIQAYATPDARKRPFWVGEAAALFANYLFTMFPLRKLYSEVNSYNDTAMRLNERLGFREHGRLPDHIWFQDRYWDMALFSLTREDWIERAERFRVLLSVEEEVDQVLERQTANSAAEGG